MRSPVTLGIASYESASPGKVTASVQEKIYTALILRAYASSSQSTGYIHGSTSTGHRISIVASPVEVPPAYVKYIIFSGMKLSVSSYEIQPPRIIFTLGGPYNG